MNQQDLTVQLNHAELFTVSLTLDGCQFNAETEGYTPSIVVKDSPATSDDDGTSYGIGTGLAWTAANKFTWALNGDDNDTAGQSYWRLDVADSNGNLYTAMAGSFTVQAV